MQQSKIHIIVARQSCHVASWHTSETSNSTPRERERATHFLQNIAIIKSRKMQFEKQANETDKHTNQTHGQRQAKAHRQKQAAERVERIALGQLSGRLPLRCSKDAHNDMLSNRYASEG